MTKNEWLSPYQKTLSARDLALLSEAYEVLRENTLCDGRFPWGVRPYGGCKKRKRAAGWAARLWVI